VINSASWNPSSGLKNGDSVGLSISTNAACSGKSFTFEIRRDQTIGSELITTKYATGGSSSASTSWDIAITSEGNYFFIASTTGVTSKSSLNTYITIPAAPASCGDGSCNNGETCSTCAQDCPCTSPQVCQSGVCVAPCSLTSASWSTTTTTEGTQVYLNVQGSNCNGKTVYFDVMEKDTLGGDDPVSILPSPVTFNSGTAKGSWIAEWQSEGIPETDPPEYYFDANVDALTIRSSNLLSVNKVSASCGNGLINTGETCDDGNTVNGDGCSAGCLVESGWYCVGEPSDCNPYCPDGSCNNGETCSTCPQDCGACANCGNGLLNAGETCDDANTLSGDGCSGGCLIESGYECDNTPMPSICWKSCGDGTLDAGETCDDGNTYSGDGCSPSCYVEIGWICDNDPMPSVCTEPNVCTISSATWSEDMVEDGDTVYINIQTANCNNGEIINLVVKEDDQSPPLTDDPVIQNPSNVVVNGNMATGSWDAEYQDDTDGNLFNPEENPPEYYFNATIISNGRFHYSDNLLNVVESGALACMGLGSCNDYATQAECEADACSLAQASLPLVTCGLSFDPETRCLSDTSCGCAWDALTSSCSPTWEEELSCGGCGNGVQDYNEQCDDGNTVNGDGCSYECKLEDRPGPCPEGLTLCSDGTCSMNCIFTDEDFASCNYNTACDTGEGCTCADCDGEQDSCEGGLLCSLEDAACCTSVSDGICIRACAFVDPDCDGNELCGNGLRELGEQCDDGNSVSGDGCSAVCLYEVLSPPCPEGLSLCNDGTCSLNCWFTDEGLDDCRDSSCCAEGLSYSIIDLACCNVYSDSICNPYCAYIDPDCGSSGISGILGIGQCIFIKNSNDDCSDGFLTRDYTHQWIWDPTNIFYANPNPSSNNYVESPIGGGEWHYDPLDINGLRRSDRCQDISDELICPAQVKLSFFGKMQFIGAFLLITLIYAIIIFRKKK
jgi:cysteine-rich repeat protein